MRRQYFRKNSVRNDLARVSFGWHNEKAGRVLVDPARLFYINMPGFNDGVSSADSIQKNQGQERFLAERAYSLRSS